jgi:hypothetical protein
MSFSGTHNEKAQIFISKTDELASKPDIGPLFR